MARSFNKDKTFANSLVESRNTSFESDNPKNVEMLLTSRVTMIAGVSYYA